MPHVAERLAVSLHDWRKILAVRSKTERDRYICLWFYEWHMFDAIKTGQHTHAESEWPWDVSEDGHEAVIQAAGMKLTVRAVADGAETALEVTNTSDHDWPEIAAIIPCVTPGAVEANTQFRDEQHERTYFLSRDGLKLLHAREIHFNEKLRERVDEEAIDDLFVWSHKWPTSDVDATSGIMIRESADGEWVAGIAWERFLSSQGHNPWKCMHLSVRVGPLGRGESRTVRGKLYLFPGTKEQCLERFRSDFHVR
jgi:hypothetical protein